MNEGFIFNLKQPCLNRGIELIDNKDGSVTINEKRFETMRECESYIESIPRIDFNS